MDVKDVMNTQGNVRCWLLACCGHIPSDHGFLSPDASQICQPNLALQCTTDTSQDLTHPLLLFYELLELSYSVCKHRVID